MSSTRPTTSLNEPVLAAPLNGMAVALCLALLSAVVSVPDAQAQSYDLPTSLPAGSTRCFVTRYVDHVSGNGGDEIIHVNSGSVEREFRGSFLREQVLRCAGANLPAYIALRLNSSSGASLWAQGFEINDGGQIGWAPPGDGHIVYLRVGTTGNFTFAHDMRVRIRRHVRVIGSLPEAGQSAYAGAGVAAFNPPFEVLEAPALTLGRIGVRTTATTCDFTRNLSSHIGDVDAAKLPRASAPGVWNPHASYGHPAQITLDMPFRCNWTSASPRTRVSMKLVGNAPPGYPHLLALDQVPGAAEGIAVEVTAKHIVYGGEWTAPVGGFVYGPILGEINTQNNTFGLAARYVDISSPAEPVKGGVANATAVLQVYYH